MATRILNVVLRLALLAAVAASVVLFVDYASSASPAFCGAGGGCAQVRNSAYSHIGPISLPMVGLGGFLGLLVGALVASRRAHYRVLLAATGLAAAGAVGLIAIQLLVIGAVCPWCMGADVAAIVSFIATWLLLRNEGDTLQPESPALRVVWAVAAAVVVVVPMVWEYGAPANVVALPEGIAKLQQPNHVNVVVFTDFECPHCRRLHGALEAAQGRLGERLRVVRLMNPLPFHKGAMPAALAFVCMPEAQKEAAANRFYTVDPTELTPQGVATIAEELGADPQALSQCMGEPDARKQIEHDQALFFKADLTGVPTSYVNAELVRGADVVALESALDRAAGGDGGGSDVSWMFVFMALVVAGAAGASIASGRAGLEAA